MNQVPVPHDLGMQLPLPEGVLKFLLVLLFLVHILFVNFMVGGVTLAFIFEIIGLKNKKFDALAFEIAKTVTVNKSLAVVLGVAPLLVINLAYTTWFYAATTLTGVVWYAVIPLVTVAFLLTYLHKYTWHTLTDANKALHLAIGGFSLALFYFIPLIFLTNVNLMLFPHFWPKVQGFISALLLQNVIPRYLHFVLATNAIAALFAAGWFTRKNFDVEEKLPGFQRDELKKLFYRFAFVITMMQFVIGPVLLFSLPVHGLSLTLYLFILAGIAAAIMFTIVLWKEISKPNAGRFAFIVGLFTITVLGMAFGRHYYRERALEPHKKMVMEKTESLYWAAEAAKARERMGITKGPKKSAAELAYDQNCAVCHADAVTLIGPPLTEIQELYEDYPEGIVEWTIAPEVKRGGAVMPPMGHLGEEKLMSISKFILSKEIE